jgi:hypothetical protein
MSEDVPKASDSQTASPPESLEGAGQSEPVITPTHLPPAPAGQLFYEFRLPDRIPDAWLTDLKNAVRESRAKLIVTTVLSSSLLTGVLSTVGNYYIDSKKAVSSAALELKKDRAKEKLRLYDSLSGKLNDFKQALHLSLLIFNDAKTKMEDKNMSSNVAQSIQSLLDQMMEIADARAKINDGELTTLIDTTVRPLTPELAKASNDPNYLSDLKAMTNLIGVCKSVSNQGIDDLNKVIERKIQTIEALEQ